MLCNSTHYHDHTTASKSLCGLSGTNHCSFSCFYFFVSEHIQINNWYVQPGKIARSSFIEWLDVFSILYCLVTATQESVIDTNSRYKKDTTKYTAGIYTGCSSQLVCSDFVFLRRNLHFVQDCSMLAVTIISTTGSYTRCSSQLLWKYCVPFCRNYYMVKSRLRGNSVVALRVSKKGVASCGLVDTAGRNLSSHYIW